MLSLKIHYIYNMDLEGFGLDLVGWGCKFLVEIGAYNRVKMTAKRILNVNFLLSSDGFALPSECNL